MKNRNELLLSTIIELDKLTLFEKVTRLHLSLLVFMFYSFFFPAAMCGITSGICFIALRDLDSSSRNIYPNGTTTLYDFSFMMEWASNSLCILEGFIFLCLLKMDYNDITETGKYNSFM